MKDSKKIEHVVVVGGGTTGWWTAGYLAFKHPGMKITLIESGRIPTTDVGESVLPQVKEFLDEMEIPESAWMQDSHAIYKLGNKFEGWCNQGDANVMTFWWNFDERLIKASLYHRPGNEIFFGSKKSARIGDYWLRLWRNGEKTLDDFFYDFSDAAGLVDNDCAPRDHQGHNYLSSWAGYAYHIDAQRVGAIVRDHVALPRGVAHVIGTVVETNIADQELRSVTLDDGRRVEGDLFIDCSGFRRVLASKFEPKLQYYDRILCDRACVAPVRYADYKNEMVPYTISSASDHGWKFNISLTSRIGSGYIYSSQFVDDAEAEASLRNTWSDHEFLAEPRLFRWIPSRLVDSWKSNVCAIGLASGFIDPLEANALYNVQYAIQTLSSLLERRDRVVDPHMARIHSRATGRMMDQTASYIYHRYAATNREDTEFWRTYKQMGARNDVHRTMWEHYLTASDPLATLYPDSVWLTTGMYMNSFTKEDQVEIDERLLDNARAIFDYNSRTSRNNGRMLPKIWEVCPPTESAAATSR